MSEREQALVKAQTQYILYPVTTAQNQASTALARDKGLPAGLLTLLFIVAIVTVMVVSYTNSGEQVTLKVNGNEWSTKTHQQTVGSFLREVGLALQPADIVLPPSDTPLEAQQTIVVQKALPVLIEADGQVIERYTHSQRVMDLLHEANLNLKPYDVLTLNGQPVKPDTLLPHYEWTPSRWPLSRIPTWNLISNPAPSPWARLKLQRAIPLSINDGGTYTTIYTVARTVGEALLTQNIILYLGDQVRPLLGTLLTAGMHVEIQRAKPVTLQVDGRVIKTRSQARNVAQLLSDAGVTLLGRDYTVPKLDAEVTQDMSVRIIRVTDEWILEAQDISYETIWRANNTLELDQRRVDQPGKVGVRKRNMHIVYEDGAEKERTVVEEWIERQPTTRIISYGTRIVLRELESTSSPIRYWRKIRMLATSYHAAAVGKPPDHPEYGITRLGWQARTGIVAVDPRVVNLRTNVYVPGYGFGVAADTGGAIKGLRIDLCYNEEEWIPWKKWVDVYLLEPVPPANEINWILPNYP